MTIRILAIYKKFLLIFLLLKVYIADLDSIQKNGSNLKIVINLLKKFPSLVFLIDCGSTIQFP